MGLLEAAAVLHLFQIQFIRARGKMKTSIRIGLKVEENSCYPNELQSHTEGARTTRKKRLSYEIGYAYPKFKEKKQR